LKKLLYIIFISLLVVACANMGSPDGGPYDEDPPKIVRTSPKYGSTVTNIKKIVLEFDENVKIENATENVIISPPQIEQPEIEAVGKKITIKLADSIKLNTTYTIDFADAIKDNNEGNPMGDYAFTFSTGGDIDTMQVSGYVLDASNLEPIKGIYVGVYELADSAAELHDSVFRTKALERVSRTDANGHFAIKGLKKAYYRAFALQDQNQNFLYDQKSEMVAFSERRFIPSCKADIKPDTVWHDSIHYDSIIYKGFTHFYPDDVTLTAFAAAVQDRNLIKCERPQLNMFSVVFSAGADTLPRITGLNFNAEDAFVIDASEKNDTIDYWIRDSLVFNIDTLDIQLDYFHNDSAGLVLACDTFNLVSKISRAKLDKEREKAWEEWAKQYRKDYRAELRSKEREEKSKAEDDEKAKSEEDEKSKSEDNENTEGDNPDEENEDALALNEEQKKADKDKSKKSKKAKKEKIRDEDIVVPPMPEEFLDVRITPNTLDPDKNIDFIFVEPIDSVDLSKIKFYTKKDTVQYAEDYVLKKIEGEHIKYRLYASWQPDSTYYMECDTGMFVNIYGKRSDFIKKSFKVGSMDTYSTLFVTLQEADESAIVQLLDGSDKVVKTIVSKNGKADFYFVKPGIYYLRMFYDHNGNGIWDTGDYDQQLQPEEMFYYYKPMELKAKWTDEEFFNPKQYSLAKQKPIAITKQKDSKKDKNKLSKNQQRLEDKKNGKNGTSSKNSSSSFNSSNLRF